MAIITGLLGLVGRFAGRLVNATLGWATTLLFGKVAQSKQKLLLVVVMLALGWVASIASVLSPDVGTLLIAAVPLPEFIDEGWVRLGMLVAALTLPLLVGVVAWYITDADQRAQGAGMVRMFLRGYPFTLVLTLTIVMLAGVALVRKVRSLSRRWQDTHVPLIIKPGAYEWVLGDVHEVLEDAGVRLQVRPAPAAVSAPARLLNAVAGRGLGALVPDQLMLLSSPELEVLVYPSDLAISGAPSSVARARAAIVAKLTEAPAYMTTSKEAQSLEDELETIARRDGLVLDPAEDIRRVQAVNRRLATLVIPFEEWETLYRQKLQVERDLLAAGSSHDREVVRRPADATASRRDVALALAAVGLVVLDVVLLVTGRGTRD